MKPAIVLTAASILLLLGCTSLVRFRMPRLDDAAGDGVETDGADAPGDLQDQPEAERPEQPDAQGEEAADAPGDEPPDGADAEGEEEPLCGNGIIDEGEECDPPGGDPSDCSTSCASTGTRTCGAACAWGDCVPPEEICNGLDEDCVDGPDSGFACVQDRPVACLTICGSEGTGLCGSDCSMPGPESCDLPDESCNGLDDDCDGAPDEGFECIGGTAGEACVTPGGVAGTKDCDPSCLWTECCGNEDCDNGFDDNCDGVVDEPGRMGRELRVTDDPGLSNRPSAAWTGSEIAVAWHDDRDGATEIYMARISDSGEKVGGDIRLTDTPGASEQPSLLWTGSEAAVAWSDGSDGNAEIYFARVSDAGEKIGIDSRITADPGASIAPSLQWTGSQFAVAWTDDRAGVDNAEVYIALISGSGEKTGDDIRLTDAGGISDMPSLAWTGSQFGLAWREQRDIDYEVYFMLVSEAGEKTLGDVRITNAAGGSGSPSLQWTGSRFALAWCDARDGPYPEIYYASISDAGVKDGEDVRITNAPNFSSFPSLQWTGSQLGVAWKDSRDVTSGEIYFTQISQDGSRLGSDVRITNNAGVSDFPVLRWTGSRFAALWQDESAGSPDIFFVFIGCD